MFLEKEDEEIVEEETELYEEYEMDAQDEEEYNSLIESIQKIREMILSRNSS